MSITSGLYSTANNLFQKYTYLPLSTDNFRSAAGTTFKSRLTALSSDSHPSSAPYLSGDTFLHVADHVLNHGPVTLDPLAINAGESVFVNSQALHYYFRVIHPYIRHPYVLITHNGDCHIDAPQAKYLDDKIIHWFAQNVVVSHPKISPIPIGLENLLYFNHGATNLFDELQIKKPEQATRVLVDFSRHTNPIIREPIYIFLENFPLADILTERLSAQNYLKQLARHQFVASPPGNGLDCHRTWEAMYLGVTPIVQASVTTTSFAALGMPMLLVDDWRELTTLTEQDLKQLHQKLWQNFDSRTLYLPYWQSLIQKLGNKI